MSGHTPWREIRESAVRAMSPQARAAHRNRVHERVEALRFEVWRLRVEEKFVNAMAAAAAGDPVTWRVWPETDPQRLIEEAAERYGFTPWTTLADGGQATSDGQVAGARTWDALGLELQELPARDEPATISYEQLLDALEPHVRSLVCAPDVYPRVKEAVEGSWLARLYEVVEHPWLRDGEIYDVAPPPPLTDPEPAEFFKPAYCCVACGHPTYVPGRCGFCEYFRTPAHRASPIGLPTAIWPFDREPGARDA